LEGSTLAENPPSKADELRVRYGRDVVIAGLVVLLIALGVAVFNWDTAQDVSVVLAALTGTVGTIVGAFFGVSVGAAGKEKAEDARDKAEEKKDAAMRVTEAYAARLDPDVAEQARRSIG
jgi:hypothetical protein